MVNHNIVRLNISVNYSLGVAEVQSFENFIDIESYVIISIGVVKGPEINITSVNVLHDERWGFGHWVSDHIDQIDDVDATSQSLQNFDLSSYLGFFDGF